MQTSLRTARCVPFSFCSDRSSLFGATSSQAAAFVDATNGHMRTKNQKHADQWQLNQLCASGSLRGGFVESNEVSSDSGRMHSLVKLQSFAGSFQLTDELCQIMGVTLDRISGEISKKSWDPTAFATCLAIAYFNTKLDSLKEQWELVVFKADNWLRKNFPDTLEAMKIETRAFVPKSLLK